MQKSPPPLRDGMHLFHQKCRKYCLNDIYYLTTIIAGLSHSYSSYSCRPVPSSLQLTHTHTHTARAHTVRKDKGSDTLAQVRRCVFKHNGSAIDARAGKNTHARAHTAAQLAQVRHCVFKHNCSTIDTCAQVRTRTHTQQRYTRPGKTLCI